MSSEQIVFNPHSLEDMIALMDAYGDSKTMFPGVNEDGETVHISIFYDKIVVMTFQNNGWHRKNIYRRGRNQRGVIRGKRLTHQPTEQQPKSSEAARWASFSSSTGTASSGFFCILLCTKL
jgi:hypothetical protein